MQALNREENRDLKLIEIDNRLRKGTSDLVLKILFGDVIAEMQLVINMNSADYDFSHKLYELKRAKFYSPLTQLAFFNERISTEYFRTAQAVIAANQSKKGDEYEEASTFKEVAESFRIFLEQLPIKIKLEDEGPKAMDMMMLTGEV